jgi:hypothetical protein
MSQLYIFPPGFASASNPSTGVNGIPVPLDSTLVGGKDPTGLLKAVSVDVSGNVNVNVGSSVLPTDAATAAKQDTGNSSLSSIDSKLSSQATASAQTTGNNSLSSIDGKITAVNTNSVTITSSVLPTDAATAAKQDTGNTSLGTIDTNIAARLSGALVPKAYDEINLTYITIGNGIGQVGTAVYKLASATQATLTLSYDSSDRLSSVVKS